MGVLALILNAAYVAYYQYVQSSLGVVRNATDIVRTTAAGERWREEVRRAARLSLAPVLEEPEEFDEERLPSPARVGEVLTLQQEGQTVLYRFEKQAVWRKGPGEGDWVRILPYVRASRMVEETRHGATSWRWELELAGASEPRIRPLFTFRAVPGLPAGLPTSQE
jgi:hypothetical protein